METKVWFWHYYGTEKSRMKVEASLLDYGVFCKVRVITAYDSYNEGDIAQIELTKIHFNK